MNVLIIDLCREKDSLHKLEFVMPVIDIVMKLDVSFDLIHFSEIDKLSRYIVDFDKVILCGVALKDFEYINHIDKFKWIKEFRGDVLGICAGAQIIGKIFGCDLEDGEEIGFVNLDIIEEDKLFEGVDLREVYCLHSSSVSLCNGMFEIARTKDYTQVFRVDEDSRNVYGVIFHPEVRNKKLIENFVLM